MLHFGRNPGARIGEQVLGVVDVQNFSSGSTKMRTASRSSCTTCMRSTLLDVARHGADAGEADAVRADA